MLLALWAGLASAQFVEPPVIEACNSTEDPLSSGGFWSGRVISTHTANVSSNGTRCKRNATTDDASLSSVGTYGPNVALSATMPDATGGTSSSHRLFLRLQNPNIINSTDGYACRSFPTAATPVVRIERIDNSTITQIGTFNHDMSDGDKWACRMVGTTIELWTDVGGTWGKRLEVTSESTYPAAGTIGLGFLGGDTDMDDVRAQTISARRRGGLVRTQ